MSHRSYGLYEKFIKRPLDFILALTVLIVLSPVFVILAVVGLIAMDGNPFFIQRRPGRISKKTGKEKIFMLIKFRTMSNARDEDGNSLPDEMRLNVYGKFLRATSLDELPKLLNIIKGDMAIVGPRPLLVKYLPYYSEEQRHRHDVRPGLTGFSQVHGWNSVSWDEKLRMDVDYTKHISFIEDIKILFETVLKVFKREGISQDGQATLEDFTEYCETRRDRVHKGE